MSAAREEAAARARRPGADSAGGEGAPVPQHRSGKDSLFHCTGLGPLYDSLFHCTRQGVSYYLVL